MAWSLEEQPSTGRATGPSQGRIFCRGVLLMFPTSTSFIRRLPLFAGLSLLVLVSTLARPSALITYGLIALAGGLGRR
jgi:hypothetical protein